MCTHFKTRGSIPGGLFRAMVLALILLPAMVFTASAQPWSVTVTIAVTPPYTSKIDDYISQPNKLMATFINTASMPQQVFVRGVITGEGGIKVMTDPNWKPSQSLTLQPGIPFRMNRYNIEQVFDADHLIYQGITKDELLYGNGLPEGEYTICMRAFDFVTGQPVSAEEPLGCSASFNVSDLEPPVVIRPDCGDTVAVSVPQNLLMTWTRPPNCPVNTQFDIKIIEVLPFDRNINDAMRSATHPVFFEKSVNVSSYVLGAADPALVPGKKYAFAITAVDPAGKANFRNKGMSEVCWFVYKATGKVETGRVLPGPGAGPGFTLGPINQVTGKLTWAFRKTEEPSSPGLFTGSGTNVNFNSNFSLPGTGGGNNTSGGNSTPGTPGIFGGGTVQTVTLWNSFAAFTGQGPDFQKQKQAKINELAGTARYPLANTLVDLHLVINQDFLAQQHIVPDPLGLGGTNLNPEPDIFLGTAITDVNGNFVLNTTEALPVGYDLWVDVKDPGFEYAGYGIRIKSSGNKIAEVGEMLGLARSFRFRPIVKDDQGNLLENADVCLLRTKNFYVQNPHNQNRKHELDRDKYGLVPDKPGRANTGGFILESYDTAAAGKSGTNFRRAFFSGGYDDHYIIAISIDKGPVAYFNFLAEDNGLGIESGVLVIEKVFRLQLPKPIVRGRVVASAGSLPVQGATVVVSPADVTGMNPMVLMMYTRFGVTDAEGRFEIGDIPVRSEPYLLSVTSGKSIHEDPSPLYLTRRGIVENRDPVVMDVEMISVCGTVKDRSGNPLAGAALHWKEGGNVFFSNSLGRFISAQTKGKHTIVAQLPGFRDTEAELNITIGGGTQTGLQPGSNAGNFQLWSGSAGNQLSGGDPGGNNFFNNQLGLPPGFGFENGSNSGQVIFEQTIGGSNNFSLNVSCDHVVTMKQFYVKAVVTDAGSKQPIQGAVVQAEFSPVSSVTGTDGTAIVADVPAGNGALITRGPDNGNYIPVRNSIAPDPLKDTTLVGIVLTPGAMASGKVTSKGVPVDKATVAVAGKEFIGTLTDSQGNYTLRGIPAGSITLQASKTGLLADESALIAETGNSYPVDFDLADPGFNATKLLGFDLVLTASKPGGVPNEFIISGKLVNLPDNPIFAKQPFTQPELPFTDQTIVSSGGAIYPKSGILLTDASEIPLRMFGYLTVVLHDDAGLTVKALAGDNTRGQVTGTARVDLAGSFAGLSGMKLPLAPLLLAGTPGNLTGAVTSDGSAAGSTFVLSGSNTGWEIYGVKLAPSLGESTVQPDGVHLKGSLTFAGIPQMGSLTLKLNNLTIAKTGQIKDIQLGLDPKPKFTLGQWTLKVAGATFDPFGLKVSGDMDLPIPSSPVAKIGFANLAISTSGITGGNFIVPLAGLNIFDAVTFKPVQGAPFAMQQVPGSSQYQLVGAGNIAVPKYLNSPLQLDFLQVTTAGGLKAKAKPGVSVNFFDMGSFRLQDVAFTTTPAAVGVSGGFKLDIPKFGAETFGGIRYAKNSVTVDQLKIAFNIQSKISIESTLNIGNEGFTGTGKFFLSSCPYPVDIDFYYLKTQQGKLIGSHFKVGTSIVIGYVKLTEISGGFDFNLTQNIYKIETGGKLTFAADPAAIVALYPMKIEITSTPQGPIFQGTADLTIMDTWKIAKSLIFVDFANKHFFFDGTTGGSFNMIKGIGVSGNQTIHIEASAAESNTWWFATGLANITALNTQVMDVYLTAGWNVRRDDHPILAPVPDEALSNGRMYGGYTHLPVDFMNTKWGPYGFAGLADVSAWFKVTGEVDIFANFKQPRFHLSAGQTGGGGLDACFIHGLGCIGIGAVAAARISGDYNNGDWSVTGHGHACGHISIGCSCGCNDWCTKWKVIPCGAKVCVGVGGSIGFSTGDGFSFGLGFEDCTDL